MSKINKHVVNIPPGTDLNNIAVTTESNKTYSSEKSNENENTQSQKRDTGQTVEKRHFSVNIFNDLPKLLRGPCSELNTNEREVFLVGALGAISGMLPNYQGKYFGKVVEPPLYCYILGKYGIGKGGLNWVRTLGEDIHKELVEKAKVLITAYKKDMAIYKKAAKLFENGKIPEAPTEPEAPPHLKLYIPANTSKTGILQLLYENKGRGVIFETEGDTLADMLKQEYGKFSDDLRKAFHHEPLSYFRRGNNNEDVEIPFPCLSVLLSSTFDQLLNLIPNIQNGLYSRFFYYELQGNDDFNDPFDRIRDNHASYFSKLSIEYKKIYDHLSQLKAPVLFDLPRKHQKHFTTFFKGFKKEIRECVSEDLEGTVNRMGLICYRICMVLSALRAFENGTPGGEIVCSDQDFENAMRIIETLKWHSISVYRQLPKPDVTTPKNEEDKDSKKIEQKNQCKELHKQGFTYREISLKVFNTDTMRQTVWRWINV